MIENGIVKEILPDGLARVKFSSSAKCAGCGACERKGGEVYLDASNEIGAKIGELVKVEIPSKKILEANFMIFIVPIIALLTGYFIGGIIWAFIFLFLSFLLIFVIKKDAGIRIIEVMKKLS